MANNRQMIIGIYKEDIGVMDMSGAIGVDKRRSDESGHDDNGGIPTITVREQREVLELDDVALAGMEMTSMMGMDDDDAPPMRPMGRGDVGGMGMAAVLRHVRY